MIFNEILNKENLSREEIIYLLNLNSQDDIDSLFKKADKIRQEYCGDEVHLRGVIKFSNYCCQNCLYCGLREENFKLSRYRMNPDEIIETAKQISNAGIRTLVLESGEDSYYDTDMIAYIIYSIKQDTDAAITLQVGERGLEEYRNWKIAGADRYILKHETSDDNLYSVYHGRGKVNERIKHLKYLKRLGYDIGSGNIIGLPSQTLENIADDILLYKSLDVDTILLNPFVPAPFTPYQNIKKGSNDLTLKAVAAARLVTKMTHIYTFHICDSFEGLDINSGLYSGANACMPNLTPEPYRGKYQIYAADNTVMDDPFNFLSNIQKKIESFGRYISQSKGSSLKIRP